MCLIVVAFGQHPDLPLIIAANRDEFHARPASAAGWWTDPADILGGRDLEAGGTWLALHRSGRIAAVTNYHGGEPFAGNARSRGYLVTEFLTSGLDPLEYLESIDGSSYAGFNLLVSDGAALAYMSNRGRDPVELEPGIYGLSNALLDSPWAKVERSKARFRHLLAAGSAGPDELLQMLSDRELGPVEEARDRHLPLAMAHAITAPFIVLPDYGTRCSTIVRAGGDGGWEFVERRFDASGATAGESRFSIPED